MPSLGWQCCGEGLGLFDTRIVPHRWFPLWVVLEQDGVQMPEGWARLFIFWSTGFFWAEGVRTSILTGLGFGEARLSSLGAVVGYLWLSVGHSELAPI